MHNLDTLIRILSNEVHCEQRVPDEILDMNYMQYTCKESNTIFLTDSRWIRSKHCENIFNTERGSWEIQNTVNLVNIGISSARTGKDWRTIYKPNELRINKNLNKRYKNLELSLYATNAALKKWRNKKNPGKIKNVFFVRA